jgi:hypothetical protein
MRGWLIRQSVEDILGIPTTRIDNPSMSMNEVIIHHLDASSGTTGRIEGSHREGAGNNMTLMDCRFNG